MLIGCYVVYSEKLMWVHCLSDIVGLTPTSAKICDAILVWSIIDFLSLFFCSVWTWWWSQVSLRHGWESSYQGKTMYWNKLCVCMHFNLFEKVSFFIYIFITLILGLHSYWYIWQSYCRFYRCWKNGWKDNIWWVNTFYPFTSI